MGIEGCRNMKGKFTIWSTIHSNHQNEITGEYWETDELFIENIELIKKTSIEVKTIIAFYSKQYLHQDYYLYTNNIDSILANALGNYTSLQEAQGILLKNKEKYFNNFPKRYLRDYPAILKIEIEKSLISLELSGVWGSHIGIDEFKIKNNGEIEYIH